MPIYEFVCQNCGNEFEKIQSFSHTIAPVCPKCQSAEVQRQMSRPAIHFKGSGWYITDSKADNKEKKDLNKKTTDGETATSETVADSASSSGEAASDANSKDTATKPETKPAAKPEAPAMKEEAKRSNTAEKSAASS